MPNPEGRDLAPALTALMLSAHAHPGYSWRVGVGRVEEADAEAAARAAGGGAGGVRSMMRQASRAGSGKVRAAVMTVAVANAEGEEEGAEQEDGAALVIDLWRADLVAATAELGPGCTITRADAALGHLFGGCSTVMLNHHIWKCARRAAAAHGRDAPSMARCSRGPPALCACSWRTRPRSFSPNPLPRYVNLPATSSLEDIMGLGATKKGGIKKAAVHKVGPRRQVQGRHADGRGLSLSMQAVLKDGGMGRLVVSLKPLAPVHGEPVRTLRWLGRCCGSRAPTGAPHVTAPAACRPTALSPTTCRTRPLPLTGPAGEAGRGRRQQRRQSRGRRPARCGRRGQRRRAQRRQRERGRV